MKKIVLYSLLFILFLLISSLSYFSIFGIKTDSFNSQIKDKINKYDKDLDVEIKKVQLFLNLKKLNIEAITFEPKITFKNKNIDINNIKTLISLKSFFKKEFAIKNLHISSKSIQIKNIISLIGVFNNNLEINILKNKIEHGYLVADIKINFDENGKIEDNYEVNGYVKEGKIDLLSHYSLNNIDFLFKLQKNRHVLSDIKISLNQIDFFSKEISLINNDSNIYVNGSLQNEISELNDENLFYLKKLYSQSHGIDELSFSSNNNFSFFINNKFKIEDLNLNSKLKLESLSFNNKKKGKYFLPEIKDKIVFKDHDIEINLKDDIFLVKGSGNILLQNKIDKIKYSINNQNELYQLKTVLEINQNPFYLQFLNYQNNKNSNVLITIDMLLNKKKQIHFKNIEIKENKNILLFKNIFLDNDFRILKIDNIDLNYIDNENKENVVNLTRKNDVYNIVGKSFNANSFVEKLLESEDKKSNLFKNDFDLNLDVDKIYLDQKSFLNDLKGNLNIVNNQVKNANINSLFQDYKRFDFSIRTENNQKITTLFSEQAEPLVQRYKFIKGYEDGNLDFYSIKKEDKSKSTLKLFDFKLQELPALTKLLTLASLQGIADTLTGEGIRFSELEMNFTNEGSLMTIDELYAIGPAISILMSGYVEKNKLVSLRGTLVPATTINKTIGSIPLLGKILVGNKVGEGVFGVSFKIKGHPDDLETNVNPLKTLTPRFITRTLEKIKKN